MRATTLLRYILGFQSTFVTGQSFDAKGIVLDVRPTWTTPRCPCGAKCPRVHDARTRKWRHLDIAGMQMSLSYRVRRVHCRSCSAIRTESVPWATGDSGFTHAFEERCAYFVQHADRSFVARTLRVAWETVGRIIRRVVATRLEPLNVRLDGLHRIGIDELSYRRHHEYITTVVNHDTGRVVWMGKGKSAETLKAFFEALGPDRAARIEVATLDMSAAFISAVSEHAPNARLVFDRFHVQRLVQDAIDATRRDEVREADEPAAKKALKGTRFQLLASEVFSSGYLGRKH